jgi:DNA invertase Pin-like site-specific DNA recombinase
MIFKYIRVSSIDQNLNRQIDGLSHIEHDKLFEDKVSAKTTERPQLQLMLSQLREGDSVFVYSIDRLARNLMDLSGIVSTLKGQGVAITFIKENLEFTGDSNPIQTLQLHMMGAFAEFERGMIKSRQAEGLASAKARGVHLGRRQTVSAENVKELRKTLTIEKTALSLGCSISTVKRLS